MKMFMIIILLILFLMTDVILFCLCKAASEWDDINYEEDDTGGDDIS